MSGSTQSNGNHPSGAKKTLAKQGGRRAKKEASSLRFELPNGVVILLEPSRTLPLVDFQFAFRFGSSADEPAHEGLTRLLLRLMRRGTGKLKTQALDETIDALGASLAVDVAHTSARFSGSVIARNLDACLDLVAQVIRDPSFRKTDFDKLKRESASELEALLEEDRGLTGRAFRRALFGDHFLGRTTAGTLASLKNIALTDLQKAYRSRFVGRNLVIGMSGDFDVAATVNLLEKHFGPLPAGLHKAQALPSPSPLKTRKLVVIDKPDRAQSQMMVGALGTSFHEPKLFELLVANTAFGGTFTSQLVREVRGKRGLSYSVGSRLGLDVVPDAWTSYAHPDIERLDECVKTVVGLIEGWTSKGSPASDIDFAKAYMTRAHVFDRDTASKRLEPLLEQELHRLPPIFTRDYLASVGRVSASAAKRAVHEKFANQELGIAVLGPAKTIAKQLAWWPGQIETIDFRTLVRGEPR